jgi:hypothetical protein
VSSVTAKLYDLASNELADISGIALERSMTRLLNLPRAFAITAPAGHSLLTATADDGYRNLRKGNRKLVVWENDDPDPIFHGRIKGVERVGDGTQNLVNITAFDAKQTELGYDADDQAGRPVRDATGNFIDPSFVSSIDSGPQISGPDLIKQILTNSQNADPTVGEGPLPIDLNTGDFDLDVPPAIDLSPSGLMDWPILCGDFIDMLIQTGVVDVNMRPVNPGDGINLDDDPDPYIMVELSAVSSFGTDRSATVHFDYWTGSKNASHCRHVEDFGPINNKLFDYLGPRIDKDRWAGNITPTAPSPGDTWPVPFTDAIAASRALYGGPDGGQFMSIRVFDSIGIENANRALYIALFAAEQGLRVEPRDMLFITPNPDIKALFDAPSDFDVGDLIAVNTGADFGIELAEAQRLYGYTKTWDRQGVARLSELITSADAE